MPYYPPILQITDGTSANTINLLNTVNGYILCDWNPARPNLNFNYMVDQQSGLRQPIEMGFDTPVDTFTFSLRDTSVDAVIAWSRKLNRILLNASKFWTQSNYVSRPYYLVVRARDEVYTRYATIFSASLHNSGNPFAQPFATNAKNKLEQDLQVSIEHDLWTPVPPSESVQGNITSFQFDPWTGGYPVYGDTADNTYLNAGTIQETDWNFNGAMSFAAAANHCAITKWDYIIKDLEGGGTVDLTDTSIASPDIFTGNFWTYFGSTSEHIPTNITLIPSKWSVGMPGYLQAEYSDAESYLNDYFDYLEIRDTTATLSPSTCMKPGIVSWIPPENHRNWSMFGHSAKWVRVRRAGDVGGSSAVTVVPYGASWNHIKIPKEANGDAGIRLDIRFPQLVWDDNDSPLFTGLIDKWSPEKLIIGGTTKEIISCISPAYSTPPLLAPAAFVLPDPVKNAGWIYSLSTGWTHTPYYKQASAKIDPSKFSVYGENNFDTIAEVQFRNLMFSGMYSGNFRAFFRWTPTAYDDTLVKTFNYNLKLSVKARLGNRSGTENAYTGVDPDDNITWVYEGPTQSIYQPRARVYVYDMGVISLGDPSYVGADSPGTYQTIDLMLSMNDPVGLGLSYKTLDLVLIPVDSFYQEVEIPSDFAPLGHDGEEYTRDVTVRTANIMGRLAGHVSQYDGSYFNGQQTKISNLSFPVGRPLYFNEDEDIYLHFFSYSNKSGDMTSRMFDTFAIDATTVPMYLSAIGNSL